MSDDSKPRLEVQHNARATNSVVLANKDILRRVSLEECCLCDCKDCTVVHQHRQEAMEREAETTGGGGCAGFGACDSHFTPYTWHQANHYRNARFNQYVHCTHTSEHVTKQEKQYISINQKLKRRIKKITKTYLQKVKGFVCNCIKSTAKITYKTNKRNNVTRQASFIENQVKRMNKNGVSETASRVGRLSMINGSTHVSKKNIVSNSFSSTNKMKHPKANHCKKLIATNLLSKLMFHLKPLLSIKSHTTNKLHRKKHTSYEEQTFILNCIFPYQHHSFASVEEINEVESNKQFREVNAVSTMVSASISSQSFNDQGNQVPSHTGDLIPIRDFEDFVKKLSTCNVHSECVLRSNDVLLQYRNKKSKTNVKKSRRVTFRGHHRRFMYKTYKQNFNKTYHTFLAEIDYTNPACPQFNRQGVGIGSTWDFCIDFGRSTTQDTPEQRGIDPALGQTDGVKTGANGSALLPFQCPPGICVSGECDPSKCFKRLKKPSPYGSHAATQSRKYKLRDQRTKENGRKRVKTKRRKGKKGRENKLSGNYFAPPTNAPMVVPPRQTVRIGSKCSFNVQLYKQTPMGLRTAQPLQRRQSSVQYDQGDTTVQRKVRGTGNKKRPLKTFECEPGVCVRGKCNPSECLKQFEGENCKANVCVPGKCDPRDCYKRQRASHTGTDTSFAGSSIGSSQVATQSRKLNERYLRAGRETLYKEKGVLSKPRAKAQLNIPNRQAVRIGSKCSFNIEFYKSWPQNGPSGPVIGDQGDISDHRKAGDAKKNGKGLKRYQCEPGVCIPGKCNANECFQELKIKQSTGTDASFTGSSKVTSQGSQASAKKRKRAQDLRAGKSTFYKDIGVSSMPRSKMPLQIGNRQVVRIGSKCSFNIEFYKSWPQNGGQTAMSEQTGIERQGKALRKYQCEPATCVPGKCNANECFQILKTKYQSSDLGSSVTGSSRGSQASTKRLKAKGGMLTTGKATFYKDTGVGSMPMSRRPLHIPNRQVVRIGSKCSFNIEIYKSTPNGMQNGMHNGFMVNEQNYQSGKITPRNVFECEPGVCIPGKCIPRDCMQRLRTPTGTDTSFTGSSISTQSNKLKSQQLRAGNKQTTTLYKEKGVSNVQRYKHTLRTSKRQAVRIGSSCSFNIEFYKDLAPPMYEQNSPPEMNFSNQGDIPMQYNGGTGKKRKKYECVPGVCIPGKCNAVKCFHQLKNMSDYDQSDSSGRGKAGAKKRRKALNSYQCAPGVCTPGKCNAMECYQRLKGSNRSENDQSDTSNRRKARTKKKHSVFKPGVCAPGVCIPGKCNAAECFHRLRGLTGVKNYECERGVCIPGKCNPKECFQIFKAKHSTDDSLTDSSVAASRASQATTKKRKNKGPELSSKNTTFYRERGASSMPRSKTPLYIRNRQAVRIGSTCSFNIEFYKEQPKKGLTSQEIQKRPRPFLYGADQDKHYPAYYSYPSSSETGGEQSSNIVCECARGLIDTENKDITMGKTGTLPKKKKTRTGEQKGSTEKRDLLTEEKEPQTRKKEIHGKKEIYQKKGKSTAMKKDKKEKSKSKQKTRLAVGRDLVVDQGEAIAVQKPEVTKKEKKRKPTQVQPSLQQSELDDAGTKPKSSRERKDKALKAKKTRQKHSQTTVRDQQSDTAVDAKVGTRNLQDQGDVTTQRNAAIRQKSTSSKRKSKRKYDQGDKGFEGEYGVQTLDNRNEGTSTDASLSKLSPRSSDSVSISRATSVNLDRKEEAERRKTQSRTVPVHKEVGTASITTSKSYDEFQQNIFPMHRPGPPGQKKQAVRIGSSCSFNIQFFRDKPLTPAQIASLRSAAIPPKREPPAVQTPQARQGLMAFIKNYCKLGGTNGQCLDSCTGVQHGSQTTQRFECMPGYCDLSICQRNQCPAKINLIDTGTATHYRGLGRPTVQSYSANAATQSRRFPGIQQMAINDSSLAALCKCMGKIGPSRGSTALRNSPYGIQGSPFGPITGFGDDVNRYQVREQAVIIGSGCGFNVNFFKKRKK